MKSYWEKTCEKNLLGSVGCGWLNYTKIEVKGIGSESFDWICLDRDVGCWQAM